MSFDVVSLFTRVPMDPVVEVAQRRLDNDETLSYQTSLSVQEIVGLLSFWLNATYLSFRGEFYQQMFGTAMGSPVSVTFANLAMEDVEERALTTAGIVSRFWKRYVDDTCVALPADQCEAFHAHVNSVEQSIQFTLERESDGKLPFLDLLLERHPDGSISTSVFRKSTHTDRYLDFDSHHPLIHKTAVVRTLQHRARMLSSSVEAQRGEESHLIDALVRNGYPKKLIRQHMRNRERVEDSADDRPEATVCLPYVSGVSEALKRVLASVGIRTCCSNDGDVGCGILHSL